MLINVEDPSQWTLYISAMNIHPVKQLGEQNPAKDAMTRILALLLVSMLIGSAIVSLAPIQEFRFLDFIPYDVFILVFIIAAVLALGFVLFAIWSAWRDRKR
jgi:phosphotransferase system  glucose/maltose/N-acetylglucosamine-specific IIC component